MLPADRQPQKLTLLPRDTGQGTADNLYFMLRLFTKHQSATEDAQARYFGTACLGRLLGSAADSEGPTDVQKLSGL